MMTSQHPLMTVLTRMDTQLSRWETTNDPRRIFLSCYRLMTRNMINALLDGRFRNPLWVSALPGLFADYHFNALHTYDQSKTQSPVVWQLAHDAC